MGKDDVWRYYIKYLRLWAGGHEDIVFEGMSPASYEEFCEGDNFLLEEDDGEGNGNEKVTFTFMT